MQATRGASLTGDTGSDQRPSERSGNQLLLVLGIAVLAWLADLGTKTLAVGRLSGHGPVHVVGSLLELTVARNPGAAFSTGTSHTVVFTVVAAVAILVILHFARRTRNRSWAVALGLLLAGVAGNLTDRVFRAPGHFRGHVVDFIALPHWPVFNLADVCINLAVLLIVILSLRGVRMS